MDSIKFRSVHLMFDGDGHHNFGIDGDGDGHHFKGDGRHVWLEYQSFGIRYFGILPASVVHWLQLQSTILLYV